MSKKKKVFLIVLDSVGIGELPDADLFNDKGSNTLKACFNTSKLNIPKLTEMGIFNIDGMDYFENKVNNTAAIARLNEQSMGKDTTIGHWEISGIISKNPLPTYPEGFPIDIINKFEIETGKKTLCNKPYSGTKVIEDYGKQHMETGDLIVYTSADSVFQIAAHEEVIPIEELYNYCKIARKILVDEHAVGRVIARPFLGEFPDFKRTSNRKDFSIEPPTLTILDLLSKRDYDVISIGKIHDIFAGRGITEYYKTKDNDDGMKKLMEISSKDFHGLCFLNLVDFDMKFGHRNDVLGYTNALNEFDIQLIKFLNKLSKDDIVIITADHGCDPSTESTDHSREYTPLLVWGDRIKNINLGTRSSFSDIAATIAEIFEVEYNLCGKSFLKEILK